MGDGTVDRLATATYWGISREPWGSLWAALACPHTIAMCRKSWGTGRGEFYIWQPGSWVVPGMREGILPYAAVEGVEPLHQTTERGAVTE
jgi:hypothetical protein